ncbi:hypothetical protein C0583_03580 [Candidatus Parcubacteria bacterium]|nr:MAG: hypothetical protein C0583_03580 [Candidatus Parcubacteria bacterium]
MSLFPSSNNYIGIDIGSTSIKIVELKKEKNQLRLANYGFSEHIEAIKLENLEKVDPVVKIIKDIIKKTGIQCEDAYSSLPTFSVFTSIINLSNVSEKDLESAIHWEAKKVIPLPLEQMILDWKKVENAPDSPPGNHRVLLTGAPKILVGKYIDVFKATELRLRSIETETFSLIRSLLGGDKTTTMIVEIGASTTDVSIVDKGIPMLNRSVDIGGDTITNAIRTRLNVTMEQAEQFKFDMGISDDETAGNTAPKIVNDTFAPIINEIKYAMELYSNKYNSKTEKIILSGGSALLPNLPEYLSRVLDKKVVIGNPWSHVSCQEDLKPLLDEIGPRMSVAVGLAMYGFGN